MGGPNSNDIADIDAGRTTGTEAGVSDSNNYGDCFFTKPEVMEHILESCNDLISQNMIYVDYSCGTNDFARMIRPLLSGTLAFDIAPRPEAIATGAVQTNWLDVSMDTMRDLMYPRDESKLDGDRLVMGLNPPFGFRGKVAKQFIDHAASMHPRLILAILPIMDYCPDGYEEIRRVKLPLGAFYRCDTKEDFEYPTFLKVYRRQHQDDATITAATSKRRKSRKPRRALEGVRIACHQSEVNVDRGYPIALVIRRIGFYACRQAYVVMRNASGDGSTVHYVHKGQVYRGVDWTQNKHSLKNAFWVVYISHLFTLGQVVDLLDGLKHQFDAESPTTRAEDVKRSPTLRRNDLVRMLNDNMKRI